MRKGLISLGVILAVNLASNSVLANSTIYTDGIGRMHFLGKDPGGNSLQQVQNFSNYDNPAQKDLTNIIYNDNIKHVDYTGTFSHEKRINVSTSGDANKSRASYSAEKRAMDASNPFTYGETNIKEKVKSTEENLRTERKRFWENWW